MLLPAGEIIFASSVLDVKVEFSRFLNWNVRMKCFHTLGNANFLEDRGTLPNL